MSREPLGGQRRGGRGGWCRWYTPPSLPISVQNDNTWKWNPGKLPTLTWERDVCLTKTLPSENFRKPSSLLLKQVKLLVAQSCPALWDPIICSPPGSSAHGILCRWDFPGENIGMGCHSRGSSWPRDWSQVSCIASRFFIIWATKKAPASC